MRKTIAVLALAGAVAVALTGCSVVGNDAPCPTPVPSGGAAAQVQVSGDFDKKPDVLVPTPLVAQSASRQVLITGDGPVAQPGATVRVEASIFDGSSGELLQQTNYADPAQAAMVQLQPDAIIPAISDGLSCLPQGSRVVVAASGEETGQSSSLIYVLDLVQVFPSHATGFAMQLPEGFPAVVTNDTGRPGVVVPNIEPPAQERIANRINGNGAVVQSGDTVLVQYTGVLWEGGKVFDSSWTKSTPATFTVPDQVVPGFAQAVVGQKVGSQVVAIVPPDQGYGDQGSGSVPAGATLVFVVDILGIL